ncbi:signal peptidase II [Dehalococcoidia bacterium]|nr:signal peptidase II [Dehalococcoidia bacterium]MCL0070370.1 signal peptidase II [Dehalococcoidia bacterium]
MLRIGLGLVLSGAMGNLIDGIWLGSVTDFIDVLLWGAFVGQPSTSLMPR